MSAARSTPAHLRIRMALLKRIEQLPPNARLPTEMALAMEFGVSRLTAHKVMTRLQQEGLVVRRGKGGSFVAREAHRVQRSGCKGRNGTLVIAYPNWFSYDFWFKVDLAEQMALQHGLSPLLCKLNPDTDMADLKAMLGPEAPRGILLLPPGDAVHPGDLAALDRIGCPCVIVAPNDQVDATRHVYSVSPDYRQIGRTGVAMLIAQGHRRIAYVGDEPWRQASRLCLAGMQQACREHGVPRHNLLRTAKPVSAWDDSSEAGYRSTADFVSRAQRPTALVFDATAGAHGGLRALRERGMEVPRDVSVLVNAADHPYGRYDWPRLATVSTPVAKLIGGAVDIVLAPPVRHVHRFDVKVVAHESIAARPDDPAARTALPRTRGRPKV